LSVQILFSSIAKQVFQDVNLRCTPFNGPLPNGHLSLHPPQAGSFIAFGYLLIRYALSASLIPIGMMMIYVMASIAFGRIVSFLYEGITSFSLFAFVGEVSLVVILYLYYRKKKNEISYF